MHLLMGTRLDGRRRERVADDDARRDHGVPLQRRDQGRPRARLGRRRHDVDALASATLATTGCGGCKKLVCGIVDWLQESDPPRDLTAR